MVSDEEILERAFLSALRQHFKKPGPWLPVQTVKAGSVFPDAKGIPQGQVWEVYVATSDVDQIALAGYTLFSSGDLATYWFPLNGQSAWVLEWTVAGAIYTQTSISNPAAAALPSGYILTDGQTLSSASNFMFYVLARRRFDLET